MLQNRVEIELTDNPIVNIQMMAPMLSEKQQYMVLGMILAQVGSKGKRPKDGKVEAELVG